MIKLTKHFRKEMLLAQNIYNKQMFLDDIEGLGQVIQNILVIKKGTYPNTPNLGVGIEDYLFEILDPITINDISSEINNQLNSFLISNNVTTEIKVEKLVSENKELNSLKIDINLADSSTNTNKELEEINLSYVFAANLKNKKVVSKLILG